MGTGGPGSIPGRALLFFSFFFFFFFFFFFIIILQVATCLRSVVAAKQNGFVDILTPLIARACIACLPSNPVNFNVDNVRVAKVLGLGVGDSTIVNGFVIPRNAEGTITTVKNAVVAVFNGGIDLPQTESKGTVLINNAQELVNYSKSEESIMEKAIKDLADAGVNVVVSSSGISELATHYLERHKIMITKVVSKFELRRLCQAIHATPLLQLGSPASDKLGHCDLVTVEEIGSTKCLIFRQERDESSKLSTIVVRGSTQNILEDIERAVDDGVNVFKQMCIDPRFVAGAGASELQLAIKLAQYGAAEPGLEQYAIKKYAEAFEVVPRTLAENSGQTSSKALSALYTAHEAGKIFSGIDVENLSIMDAKEQKVFDHIGVKLQAIEFATNAATTILQVDQIIMQKQAGGPKVPKQGGSGAMDADDEGF